MKDLTATEASRRFSEVLDAVEHRGETFVIRRNGRPVAHLRPAATASGAQIKALIRRRPPDRAWPAELRDLRANLRTEDRNWPG